MADKPLRILRAQEGASVARLAAMLARAFFDDAEMVYAFPDAGQRALLLPRLIALNVRYGMLFGEVYTTADTQGAAIWLPPAATTYTLARMARVGMVAAPLRLGWRPLSRLASVGRFAAHLHRQHAPGRHWYLAQIGVEPSCQGRGTGSALLEAMTPRIADSGLTCYLETANPANVDFYERHGFRVAAQARGPREGPMLWAMLRDTGRSLASDTRRSNQPNEPPDGQRSFYSGA